MATKIPIKINTILEGMSPSRYFGVEGTFDQSIAIDPDYPVTGAAIRTSGFLVPTAMAKFSSSNVTGTVVSIVNNPKDTLTYIVLSNGRLISYDSSLGSETLIGTVTGSTASSATYYNNYIYIFGTNSGVDVARYGPLNGTPALTNGVWTGSTLGSQTALTNTTYPSMHSVVIPNHVGHYHTNDNCLYFTDFINGRGLIHRIKTKKVTFEGDTNDTTIPSAYGVLQLPFGFYPTSISSFGTSLMSLGQFSSDATINQGSAAFVLWDTANTISWYQMVNLEDPFATALLNVNGKVYIWSGNGQSGFRFSTYSYGETVTDIAFFEEGNPPFATAVDAIGNKIVWGGYTSVPATTACIWSYGSKDSRLPTKVQNIGRTTSAGTAPIVTALKYVQQASNITPKAVVAWHDGSSQGVDQYSTSGTLGAYMRWTFNIGQKFNILKIRLPFGGAVAANTTITPTVYFDDLSSSLPLTVINNTNFSGSRKVIYKTPEMKNFIGENNFTLELAWTGTNPLPVALPIQILVELKDDEPNT